MDHMRRGPEVGHQAVTRATGFNPCVLVDFPSPRLACERVDPWRQFSNFPAGLWNGYLLKLGDRGGLQD